jgi:hypothetical protein
MPEKPTRVGDLIKAKEVSREDLEAAIATVFDGKSPLALGGGGYALILPDLAKMTPFAREAILSTLIEAGTEG